MTAYLLRNTEAIVLSDSRYGCHFMVTPEGVEITASTGGPARSGVYLPFGVAVALAREILRVMMGEETE